MKTWFTCAVLSLLLMMPCFIRAEEVDEAEGDSLAVEAENLVITTVKTGDYQKIKAVFAQFQSGQMINPADAMGDGDNSLHIAAKRNFGPQIVKFLLNAGVRYDGRNLAGETPLDIYKKNKGNKQSIKILEHFSVGK